MAHTIDYVRSKILNHGLNHGLLFSLFKFFGWKNLLNQLENSGLKSRFLFCLIFQFYILDVQANLPETDSIKTKGMN